MMEFNENHRQPFKLIADPEPASKTDVEPNQGGSEAPPHSMLFSLGIPYPIAGVSSTRGFQETTRTYSTSAGAKPIPLMTSPRTWLSKK